MPWTECHVMDERRRHHSTAATFLSRPTDPNALWCVDYKGEFRGARVSLPRCDHRGHRLWPDLFQGTESES
jgi:hypothetical protein